ncbi:uncharacterized protein F4822DRAFT_411153 [Hypoxylon trugodes]|uniref:uncharacterized protein n=1 Tax=Hypoxylon trugodes TaxID=326681 RepID=UPI0021992610|nr:uncharacterized protein F4822DRAFT_411153 [Hypoxylon trugodes]KAI1386764.1 hypothetical protein F4822DRAFT_411153 [Hypoxylon trugodes]
MCKHRDLFNMCGCRFIDEMTGEWKYEIENCDRGRKRQRPCAKPEIALPIFAKDSYCEDPDCPAYDTTEPIVQ